MRGRNCPDLFVLGVDGRDEPGHDDGVFGGNLADMARR